MFKPAAGVGPFVGAIVGKLVGARVGGIDGGFVPDMATLYVKVTHGT